MRRAALLLALLAGCGLRPAPLAPLERQALDAAADDLAAGGLPQCRQDVTRAAVEYRHLPDTVMSTVEQWGSRKAIVVSSYRSEWADALIRHEAGHICAFVIGVANGDPLHLDERINAPSWPGYHPAP